MMMNYELELTFLNVNGINNNNYEIKSPHFDFSFRFPLGLSK